MKKKEDKNEWTKNLVVGEGAKEEQETPSELDPSQQNLIRR